MLDSSKVHGLFLNVIYCTLDHQSTFVLQEIFKVFKFLRNHIRLSVQRFTDWKYEYNINNTEVCSSRAEVKCNIYIIKK